MMGQAVDDLDSSDDEDHFPPSQVFVNEKQQSNAVGGAPGQSKAAKFDKLLKVSESSKLAYLIQICNL